MKDKLFQHVDIIFKRFYCCIMWIVYKYKTFGICKGTKKISPQYKNEIYTYWKKYYRKINISDFKWYLTKRNFEDVKFIPDVVFYSKIEPYFNDIKSMEAFSNKCYYNLFFQGFKVPYTIAKNINGVYMSDDFRILSFGEVIKLCMKEDEIIIKPAIDSGGGRNITFLKMNMEDVFIQLEDILKRYNKNYVIQRVVIQHEVLRNINDTSLNTVRIQSFLFKGNVYILSCFLRMGMSGSRVDNVTNGGLGIAIEDNGIFQDHAQDEYYNTIYSHPNGYVFKGHQMPGYDKMIESVKELHPRFANFGFIGWDIAIDEVGEPVFIEYNLMDTCIRAPQISYGPLFKELTDEVLDEVFGKKRNKKRVEK